MPWSPELLTPSHCPLGRQPTRYWLQAPGCQNALPTVVINFPPFLLVGLHLYALSQVEPLPFVCFVCLEGGENTGKVWSVLYRFLSDILKENSLTGRECRERNGTGEARGGRTAFSSSVREKVRHCIVFDEHFREPFQLFSKRVNEVFFRTFLNKSFKGV